MQYINLLAIRVNVITLDKPHKHLNLDYININVTAQ